MMARTTLQFYFLATGVVFSAIFLGLVYRAIQDDHPFVDTSNGYLPCVFWSVISASPFVAIFLTASVCLHISHVKSSKSHTVVRLFLAYALNQAMRFGSIFIRRQLNTCVKQPRRTQETLLKDRINRDANTHYGKKHNFRNINSLTDLKNQHPLTTYEHYAEYVQRMANGEENVLVCENLVRFGITSGTTGKGKLIPMTKSREWTLMSATLAWFSVAGQKFGWPSPLQKEIVLYVNPRPTTTAGGYIVGPMHLFTDDVKWLVSLLYNSVWEACSITTDYEATYLILLLGLCDRNVGRFSGPFSSMVHKAIDLLEKNWERIVHDISTGTIDQELEISPEVREACQKQLSPDPERAQELRVEFQKGFDGIMRRVWPHLVYIIGINTSSFTEKLENGYARGVPIFSPIFASTEGDYGINLWPGEIDRYVLIPYSVIYEFIPENNINEDQPATLLIDEVKKGEIYEMVVSTTGGFYRYRFGDVIEVVDFHHDTPVVKFMYRSGQLLNLRGEKVTEISVNQAVCHVAATWPEARLVHWTSAESTLLSNIPNDSEFEIGTQFYLIFVELEGDVSATVLEDKQQQECDDVLKDGNNYYRGYRNAGTISPPRVYLVKPGTFKLLQDHIVANTSASYNQFKVPRKLKTADTLKLMLNERF